MGPVVAGMKRKPSYVVRKEQLEALKGEKEALQKQLRELQGATPEAVEQQRLDLWKAISSGKVLRDVLRDQQMQVATTQTKVLQLQAQRGNPLSRQIRLSEDWTQRRQELERLKHEMLAGGCRYVAARGLNVEQDKPYFSEHRFEDDGGHFHCERFELFKFEGKSLLQVFNAVQFFVHNMEISISETLGHTTVREDYGSDESISSYRLVSTDENAVTTEMNIVAITDYFEQREEFGCPCAVFVTDSVDEDELYPYSSDRVRRDVSAAIVLTELRPDGQEVAVLMQRAAFATTYRPAFELSRAATDALQDNVASWGDVMMHAMRAFIQAS